MNGFERRKERKKMNILDAALELFSTDGVQKVSIQEIASKAQVSQVTIYNYFGGKDELVFESIKKFTEDKISQFQAVLDDNEKSFKDKLRDLLRDKNENILLLNSDFLRTIMSDRPEIQEFIKNFSEQTSIPLFMELVKQGRNEGVIHKDLSFKAVLFYLNMYSQAMQSRPELFQYSEEADYRFIEELTQLFFYGLMGNSEGPTETI
ncbi:TetR/AcrR family transcriptional regulator [Halobacillus rhizosphaerae]|uniref:TetR/AcrR family transcriptional regulator n=1 Tax=Halobacillus rhizosphaerae TaxID=3064889 RepID=UPI00398B4D6C